MLALKANQETLFEDVRLFLDDSAVAPASATTTDGAHGRIEIREAARSIDIAWLQEDHAWPGLQAVGRVSASREMKDETRQETRYFLMSQAFSPERILAVVRAHWGSRTGCMGFWT